MNRLLTSCLLLSLLFNACLSAEESDERSAGADELSGLDHATDAATEVSSTLFAEQDVMRFDDPGVEGNPWLGSLNLVTFFTDGQNLEAKQRFYDEGFTKQVLDASGCLYFLVPGDSVSIMVEKGRRLGYESYGFLCESLTKPNLRIAVSNQMEVRFSDMTSLAPLSAKYDLKEVASFGSKGAIFRFFPNDLNSLVRTIYQLRREKGVASVHFDFRGCEAVAGDL